MGQGCCSWHGGECGCQDGRDACCDGTLSPSCTCHNEIWPQCPLWLLPAFGKARAFNETIQDHRDHRRDHPVNRLRECTHPGNYRRQTESLSQDYYPCDSGSTGTAASTRWNQYGGSSYVGPHINSDLLLRCMEAHNYRLRRATTGEWVAGIVFLPLTVPLVIMTAGMYPGDSVRIGGGSAKSRGLCH